jgi:hypothetical protein
MRSSGILCSGPCSLIKDLIFSLISIGSNSSSESPSKGTIIGFSFSSLSLLASTTSGLASPSSFSLFSASSSSSSSFLATLAFFSANFFSLSFSEAAL